MVALNSDTGCVTSHATTEAICILRQKKQHISLHKPTRKWCSDAACAPGSILRGSLPRLVIYLYSIQIKTSPIHAHHLLTMCTLFLFPVFFCSWMAADVWAKQQQYRGNLLIHETTADFMQNTTGKTSFQPNSFQTSQTVDWSERRHGGTTASWPMKRQAGQCLWSSDRVTCFIKWGFK